MDEQKPYPITCKIGADIAVGLATLRGEITAELHSHTEVLKSMKTMQQMMNDRIEKMLEIYDERIKGAEQKIENINNKIIKAAGVTTGISLSLSVIGMFFKSFFRLWEN